MLSGTSSDSTCPQVRHGCRPLKCLVQACRPDEDSPRLVVIPLDPPHSVAIAPAIGAERPMFSRISSICETQLEKVYIAIQTESLNLFLCCGKNIHFTFAADYSVSVFSCERRDPPVQGQTPRGLEQHCLYLCRDHQYTNVESLQQ